MKHALTVSLLLLFFIPVSAQKREYLDQFGDKTKKELASSYRITTKTPDEHGHTLYFVQEFYLTDTLKSAGYYKDKDRTQKEGLFLWFAEDGSKILEQSYSSGELHGRNVSYYANGHIAEEHYYRNGLLEGKKVSCFENGSPKQQSDYKAGELNGETVFFHNNGQPFQQRTYVEGIQTGKARTYYEDGRLEGEESYVLGKREGESRWYFPDGQLSSVEQYAADTLVSFSLYNADGSRDTVSRSPGTGPEFPGGMQALKKYLVQNMYYPQKAIDLSLEGKVYLMFRVTKKGEIRDVELVAGIPGCPECDAEAIRVVKSMPDWTPGKSHNHYTDVHYALPVSFTLR